MTSEEKLAAARAEVTQILKKYDVVGAVVVATQSDSSFGLHLTASWSCAKVEDGSLYFVSSSEIYPDPEEKKKIVIATTSAVYGVNSTLQFMVEQLTGLLGQLGKHFDMGAVVRFFPGR
jgi:exosome complex RNA-binding protein Rrp4